MGDRVKLMFPLVQDADGYPPVATEGLWAQKVADGYVLDNIPFFAREATIGDTVSVVEEDGVLWFSGVVKRSSSSLIRLAMFNPGRFDELRGRDDLSRLRV